MASFANRTPASLTKDMVSVMAQAKPAIISPSTPVDNYSNNQVNANQEYNKAAHALSEKINATLKLSTASNARFQTLDAATQDRETVNFDLEPKVKFIEDDSIIQRQNASNQMRQAAVMAAVASQQKVRLSATERLALTAKRPSVQPPPKPAMTQVQQPIQPKTQHQPQGQPTPAKQLPSNVKGCPPTSTLKTAPMLTLKTLLAVQRQLQQHTKQHLNDLSQQTNQRHQNYFTNQQGEPYNESIAGLKSQHTARGKLLPPSPPCETLKKTNTRPSDLNMETYDKDLPPLPASISPSTSTDDSQLNSLESHQSSPPTSLVSLPPPPPPISSYLQQYDEVNGCHRASASSSPSTASTCEISSVKQFPATIPIKSINSDLQPGQNRIDLPLPFKNPLNPVDSTQVNSSTGTKISSIKSLDSNNFYKKPQPTKTQNSRSPHLEVPVQNYQPHSNVSNQIDPVYLRDIQQNELRKPSLNDCSSLPANNALLESNKTHSFHDGINFAQPTSCPTVKSISEQSSSPEFLPLPPPPLSISDYNETVGFDQPDSGSFRFPTPPPLEMLLKDVSCESGHEDEDNDVNDGDDIVMKNLKDESRLSLKLFASQKYALGKVCNIGTDLDDKKVKQAENDEDYQCRIPTPPSHRPMLVTCHTANTTNQQQGNQLESLVEQKSSAIFDASTFTASSMHMGLQPPPLFRQQLPNRPNILQQQQHHQYQNQQTTKPSVQPQLTVHINNDGGGLLSTAPVNPMDRRLDSNHQHHNHLQHLQHHHIMMAMTTSSSSPSSSSDGDGQSSNSSSSTSGIHSSIDSPSLSNSNDFNYCSRSLIKHDKSVLSSTNNFSSKLSSKHEGLHTKSNRCLTSVNNSNPEIVAALPATVAPAKPRPALKQRKTVSFSDKVELVACAEEQSEDHLPNPLLARVLAEKLQ